MTENCKFSYLQSNNSKIIQLVNMHFYYNFFVLFKIFILKLFVEIIYLLCMEKSSGGARAFKMPHKSAFVWDMGGLVILFFKPNTTLFVSLDNLSILTISDLFVPHSFFHPIDPKNGLNLSSLLFLCSFSAAFVVGEDDILVFYFDW